MVSDLPHDWPDPRQADTKKGEADAYRVPEDGGGSLVSSEPDCQGEPNTWLFAERKRSDCLRQMNRLGLDDREFERGHRVWRV